MHLLCLVDDISPQTGYEASVPGADGPDYLALFLVDGQVHGYMNICPHQGRNLNLGPNEFLFGKNGQLICPHHGACFDVSSGECTQGPCQGASLSRVGIEVKDGQVWTAHDCA